jgi:hypothetical protein
MVRQEEAERNIGHHPREAEGARHDPELPVGERRAARDVGQDRGKAPLETRLEKVVRQSRAVRDVTRPFMVNHCPMTEATIRLDVRGDVARMTFDRPHVLNAATRASRRSSARRSRRSTPGETCAWS